VGPPAGGGGGGRGPGARGVEGPENAVESGVEVGAAAPDAVANEGGGGVPEEALDQLHLVPLRPGGRGEARGVLDPTIGGRDWELRVGFEAWDHFE